MKLQVANQLAQSHLVPTTYTDSNLGAGDINIPVKNINSFSQYDVVQFGNTGEAEAEQGTIVATPAGNAWNLVAGLRFDHAMDTPIYNIKYGKIIFKRSTTGTAGTATPIPNGTVFITPNLPFTEFDDTSGAATYAYKTQYFNSNTSDLSVESDWFVPGGPSFYALQKIRERVKNKLWSASYIKDDSVIDEWINEYLEEMNTAAIKVNKGYLQGTTSVAFGTTGIGTITDVDFMYANKIEVTQDGSNYTPTTLLPVNQYSDDDTFDANAPRHTWIGDTILQFHPVGVAGTARVTYSKGEPVLVDDGDELPHPMRRYTRGFTAYALGCAQELDSKESLANKNYAVAQKVKQDFINEITPRDYTGPQYIDFTDTLSGFQEDSEYF